MIIHYFKIAIRNLFKQKMLAFINVFGLSAGIACFSLFLLYSINELNFDKFHKNAKNIYRIYEWTQNINNGDGGASTSMPMPLADALKQDLPDVMDVVRLRGDRGGSLVRVDKNVYRESVSYADPGFFSVFSFPLKYGDAKSALQSLNNLVVTESKAKQLFGTVNAVGRTVQLKVDTSFQTFTISAIAKDIPANSSIQFDMIGNFHFLETTEEGKGAMNNWYRTAYLTYVQLRQGSNLPSDTKRLIRFRQNYYPDEAENMKKNGMKWKGNGPPVVYGLQPLTNIHTDPKIDDINRVDTSTIWILLSIAAGILLIACINFTTLAIGRSASRSKEVGVRKVAGAEQKQLVFQFLSEALLLSVISTAFGLLLANLLLPFFNQLSARNLTFDFRLYPQLTWLLTGLALLVGLLSGSYPALVLSAFNPIHALKNKVHLGGVNGLTKSLVTFQFTLSIALIISTVIIMQQTNYMSSKNPGYNKENVVLVDASEIDTKKFYPLFKQALLSGTQIAGVTSAAIGLGEGEDFWVTGFKYHGKPVYGFMNPVDRDYIKVLGMQVIAGRNFNNALMTDTINSVIVNEAMVKEFGWTLDNAVGQQLDGFMPGKIPVVVGVVKNFNFRPAGEEVKPQMFVPFFDPGRTKIFIRLNPGDPANAISLIEKTWKDFVPDTPLKYSFLDEKLEAFYKTEHRWSSIIGWAGGISIFLACLGLFGLASLSTINRVKEIGIRKVLGASVPDIITLISKDFLKLIAIALLVASPIAWYFMNKWLQSYDYRIDISYTVFIFSGVFAIIIAFITISFQAIKAAIANPVKSLRTE
jgi:putative ABC transport system permease protein